ncbi:RTA1 like protein-domain-containing protein [Mycena epipterygia]|nr:RTA1 like protein-domain-containing protein [Mycena epipterygia]
MVRLLLSPYGYTPTEYVCLIFVALFALSTVIHLGQLVRYRMWWLLPSIVLAGALEVLGWAARFWSSISVLDPHPYEIQIIVTLIAPTPLAAANFMILGRVITLLGPAYSRLSAKRYTTVFLIGDIFSLFVQGIGGGMAASAVTKSKSPKLVRGGHIMLVGIILQLVAIFLYASCAAEFLLRYFYDRPLAKYGPERPARGFLTPRIKVLLSGMSFNTLCLLVRAIYRVVELATGFRGFVSETQIFFNVLDGAMIVLAIWTLNFTHPGFLLYNDPKLQDKEREIEMPDSPTRKM